MRFKLMMFAILLTFTCCQATFCQSEEDPTSSPLAIDVSKPSVKFQYHKFTILKHNDSIIALHVMPDPRFGGWDGINYRWYRLTNGTDEFFVTTPEESDNTTNPDIETGTGDTDEGKEGNGWIAIEDLSIKWSKCNQKSGWLYLGEVRADLQIYPLQFRRIEDFTGELDAGLWKKVVKR